MAQQGRWAGDGVWDNPTATAGYPQGQQAHRQARQVGMQMSHPDGSEESMVHNVSGQFVRQTPANFEGVGARPAAAHAGQLPYGDQRPAGIGAQRHILGNADQGLRGHTDTATATLASWKKPETFGHQMGGRTGPSGTGLPVANAQEVAQETALVPSGRAGGRQIQAAALPPGFPASTEYAPVGLNVAAAAAAPGGSVAGSGRRTTLQSLLDDINVEGLTEGMQNLGFQNQMTGQQPPVMAHTPSGALGGCGSNVLQSGVQPGMSISAAMPNAVDSLVHSSASGWDHAHSSLIHRSQQRGEFHTVPGSGTTTLTTKMPGQPVVRWGSDGSNTMVGKSMSIVQPTSQFSQGSLMVEGQQQEKLTDVPGSSIGSPSTAMPSQTGADSGQCMGVALPNTASALLVQPTSGWDPSQSCQMHQTQQQGGFGGALGPSMTTMPTTVPTSQLDSGNGQSCRLMPTEMYGRQPMATAVAASGNPMAPKHTSQVDASLGSTSSIAIQGAITPAAPTSVVRFASQEQIMQQLRQLQGTRSFVNPREPSDDEVRSIVVGLLRMLYPSSTHVTAQAIAIAGTRVFGVPLEKKQFNRILYQLEKGGFATRQKAASHKFPFWKANQSLFAM